MSSMEDKPGKGAHTGGTPKPRNLVLKVNWRHGDKDRAERAHIAAYPHTCKFAIVQQKSRRRKIVDKSKLNEEQCVNMEGEELGAGMFDIGRGNGGLITTTLNGEDDDANDDDWGGLGDVPMYVLYKHGGYTRTLLTESNLRAF